MTRKKYSLSLIYFPQDDGGYHIECPELDGCFTCADSIEEGIEIMREMIPEYLEGKTSKSELCEEMFRLGHCLPGKIFREIEVETTEAGEVVFPALAHEVEVAS
jgi:predicted RNase H-like HicB family nuclease